MTESVAPRAILASPPRSVEELLSLFESQQADDSFTKAVEWEDSGHYSDEKGYVRIYYTGIDLKDLAGYMRFKGGLLSVLVRVKDNNGGEVDSCFTFKIEKSSSDSSFAEVVVGDVRVDFKTFVEWIKSFKIEGLHITPWVAVDFRTYSQDDVDASYEESSKRSDRVFERRDRIRMALLFVAGLVSGAVAINAVKELPCLEPIKEAVQDLID